MNRRDFFRNAPRALMLVTAAAWLVTEATKRQRLANDPSCQQWHPCAECRKFNQCVLPKAEDFRNAQLDFHSGSVNSIDKSD